MKEIYEYLMECPEDERECVENQKRARKIDPILARSTSALYLKKGKYMTENQLAEIREKVRLHLNVVIVSIALSKTEDEMMTLVNTKKIIGRHVVGKKVKRLPDATVHAIRGVVQNVDREHNLSIKGKNDKIIVRKKVNQISSIISELVSRYGYNFPWPEIDVEDNF